MSDRPDSITSAAATSESTPAAQNPDTELSLETVRLAESALRFGMDAGQERGPRFERGSMLGLGAHGTVHVLRDRDLEREVAAKVLSGRSPEELEAFVREARILAALSHPNVVPIHDIGISKTGEPFFLMRRIEGTTLADAIDRSTSEHRVAEIRDLNAVVTIMIHLGQALAYAHSQGVIHQDVKPGNVMLGGYGEVLLVDWGIAVRGAQRNDQGRCMGTPLYMSPEHADLQAVDQRSDIYSLGATCFHTLFLRPPWWHDDAQQFWNGKRQGLMQPLTAHEKRSCPPALLAIVMRCLAPKPGQRYAIAQELVEDLIRFQAGLRVTAYAEPLWTTMVRWFRSHRLVTSLFLAALGAILALVVVLRFEYLKQSGGWHVLYQVTFAGMKPADLAKDWQLRVAPDQTTFHPIPLEEAAKAWHLTQGGLEIDPNYDIEDLSYAHPIGGDIAIEWDGTAHDGDGNLNVIIAGNDRKSGLTCHIGGFGIIDQCRLTKGLDYRTLATSDRCGPFLRNTTHHFKMVVQDGFIQLEVDGRNVMSYEDDADLLSPARTFAFDGCFHQRWSIAGIRILRRRMPEHMSPLALGDDAVRRRDFQAAECSYRALSEEFSGTDLGTIATFKAEIAALADGSGDTAALHRLLAAHPEHALRWRALSACIAAEQRQSQLDLMQADLSALAREPKGHAYHSCLYDLIQGEQATIAKMDVHVIGGPHLDPSATGTAKAALERVRDWTARLGDANAAETFDSQVYNLLAGHGEARAVRDMPLGAAWQRRALLAMGSFDDLSKRNDLTAQDRAWIAVAHGDFATAIQLDGNNWWLRHQIGQLTGSGEYSSSPEEPSEVTRLFDRGDADAMLSRYPGAWETRDLLINQGRLEEALASGPTDFERGYRILARYSLTDQRRFSSLLAKLQLGDPIAWDEDVMTLHELLPVLAEAWAGRDTLARQRLQDVSSDTRQLCRGRIRYLARALLGDLDEAGFVQQPVREQIDYDTHLMRAWKGELAHHVSAAISEYACVLKAPNAYSQTIRDWVHARMHALDPATYPVDPFAVHLPGK